ncbi:MAG: class I SAM-dependent methyltransferase [Chloroflexi bacterium]|nr:class I SAM-dependent methyltransferase [Chloroflexota bacterium]
MHLEGRKKLGYFPLPLTEASRIGHYLSFPASASSALDPCVGDGGAFATITSGSQVIRYGIELDAYRVEQARPALHEVIQGSAFDVHCAAESVSCIYLNSPYDFECGEGRNLRFEQLFLEHVYRWIKPGGVLILVVPGPRLQVCDTVLAVQFKVKKAYRLSHPESAKYKQIVLFGVRRTRREREQVRDRDVERARALLSDMSRKWEQLPFLSDDPGVVYAVPESGPVQLEYRGLPLDEIEDMLPKSAAWRQASRVLFAPPRKINGRPLTPLHAGHVALCAVGGMLDGIFGSGEDRHVSAWRSVKMVDRSEEVEPDGTVIQRERERFSQELTLIYATGKTAILR